MKRRVILEHATDMLALGVYTSYSFDVADVASEIQVLWEL